MATASEKKLLELSSRGNYIASFLVELVKPEHSKLL